MCSSSNFKTKIHVLGNSTIQKKIIDTGEMKYTDNFDGNLKSKYTFIFGNCLSVSLIKKKT